MSRQMPRRRAPSGDASVSPHEPWTVKPSLDYFGRPSASSDNESRYHEKTLPAKYIHPKSSVRKYSLLWFSRKWDRALEARILPRIIYSITGILALSVWMAVVIFFVQEQMRYQISNDRAEESIHTSSRLNEAGRLLTFEGALRSFDPVQRLLEISWTPKYSDVDGNTKVFGVTNDSTYRIGIWRDLALRPETRPIPSFINSTVFNQPIYMVDNTSAPAIAQIGQHPWDSFDTEIFLGQVSRGSSMLQPQFGFPFDKWTGSLTFVANFMDLATSSGLENSFGVPVYNVYLVDSIFNWRIKSYSNNTCAVNGNFWPDPQTVPKCELQVTFEAIRPGLVIFAAVVAVIVNWLSTIFIFIMTCEGVVLRRASVIEGPQLLAVCFTALFALPSVRSLLPGAPDFGAIIDLVGIIPNVIVVSLCTTAVAIESLRSKHRTTVVIE